LVHANIRTSWGPLTRIITGPRYHRVHHSIDLRHRDKNFATFLPLWDIVFGTYYDPDEREPPRTGVSGEPNDPDLRQILFGPQLPVLRRYRPAVSRRPRPHTLRW
jgi:sterol desaturase/sphingolipid hydroxylase (fatty acid hydroxylase superfamily)